MRNRPTDDDDNSNLSDSEEVPQLYERHPLSIHFTYANSARKSPKCRKTAGPKCKGSNGLTNKEAEISMLAAVKDELQRQKKSKGRKAGGPRMKGRTKARPAKTKGRGKAKGKELKFNPNMISNKSMSSALAPPYFVDHDDNITWRRADLQGQADVRMR